MKVSGDSGCKGERERSANVSADEERLRRYLLQNERLAALIARLSQVQEVTLWVGAGAIAQTVWNGLAGRAADDHIKDYDIVYFDPKDRSAHGERQLSVRLHGLLQDLGLALDVCNQARVHTWYHEDFGRRIEPYDSLFEAVRSWPTTATCVAVRSLDPLEYLAPFGIDDLLAGVVRPNKTLIDRGVYEDKVLRWTLAWPELQVVAW